MVAMKVKQRMASFVVYVTEHSGLMSSFFSACEDVYIYWLFSLTWKLVILSTMSFQLKKKKKSTISLLLYIVLIAKIPELGVQKVMLFISSQVGAAEAQQKLKRLSSSLACYSILPPFINYLIMLLFLFMLVPVFGCELNFSIEGYLFLTSLLDFAMKERIECFYFIVL